MDALRDNFSVCDDIPVLVADTETDIQASVRSDAYAAIPSKNSMSDTRKPRKFPKL